MTTTEFEIGQRVGIVTGLQSVDGPRVTSYGTVVRTVMFWTGITEYVVREDDGTELVYRNYLLRALEEESMEKRPRYVVNVRPRMMDKWVEDLETVDLDAAITRAEELERAGNYDALVWDRSRNGWYES